MTIGRTSLIWMTPRILWSSISEHEWLVIVLSSLSSGIVVFYAVGAPALSL